MSFNLGLAKKLTFKIDQYESYIERFQTMIIHNKKRLKPVLKKLSKRENIEYGYKCGFIDEPTYLITMQKLEEKENEVKKIKFNKAN